MADIKTADIKLKDVIKTDTQPTWVEYPANPKFRLQLSYLGRQDLRKIYKTCLKTTWNMSNHRREEMLDEDKFQDIYLNKIILCWEGLTIDVLKSIVPIKVDSEVPEDYIFPYTLENKKLLVDNSPDFDNWLTEIALDFETFETKKIKEEQENL